MAQHHRPPTHRLERIRAHTHSEYPVHTSSSLSPLRVTLSCQGLYCDIRQLVQFIKESHGNVFRRVALSALLDSAEKVTTTKKPEEREEPKPPGPRRYWPVAVVHSVNEWVNRRGAQMSQNQVA